MIGSNLRLLTAAIDVTPEMLEAAASTVEDWFLTAPLRLDDFIDRLCEDHLNPAGWDIEDMTSPAVAKLIRHARRVRREATS